MKNEPEVEAAASKGARREGAAIGRERPPSTSMRRPVFHDLPAPTRCDRGLAAPVLVAASSVSAAWLGVEFGLHLEQRAAGLD
jgi:hypothetical protein